MVKDYKLVFGVIVFVQNLLLVIHCNGPGQFGITANLISCKTYYLFVDGCSEDVCDFTITTI
ncbi:MAG: hypothetical protein IPO85_14020 [Saprospiraceae bacterium]|uniref:Uncharacterized protein n=1 Tax=Candidatus Defluviibacterium haderslevense TaxID=2981993 RepID=A0A9D7XE32_9BACT|nr:hypothetical protein [Candidatus Defluviibacterium haderslevense]